LLFIVQGEQMKEQNHEIEFRKFENDLKKIQEEHIPTLPEYNPEWINATPKVSLDDSVFEPASPWRQRLPAMGSAAALILIISGVALYGYLNLIEQKKDLAQSQAPAPVAQPVKGFVSNVSGKIRLIRSNKDGSLDRNAVIKERDTLIAETGGQIDLILKKSGSLRVFSESSVTIQELSHVNGEESRIVLLLKRGKTVHRHAKELSRSLYRIETPHLVAETIGTAFAVSVTEGETYLLVQEGALRVVSSAGSEIIADPGTPVVVGSQGKIATSLPKKITTQLTRALNTIEDQSQNSREEILNAINSEKQFAGISTEGELEKRFDRRVEIIETNDGREYRGIVLSETKGKLIVRSLNETILLDRDEIKRIRYSR